MLSFDWKEFLRLQAKREFLVITMLLNLFKQCGQRYFSKKYTVHELFTCRINEQSNIDKRYDNVDCSSATLATTLNQRNHDIGNTSPRISYQKGNILCTYKSILW